MRVDRIDAENRRAPEHDVLPLIVGRWSPRAMSGNALAEEDLATLFEAARWAPSSYNRQPWRFLYAPRDSEHWSLFFDLLGDFNQSWAKDAAALVVVLSHRTHDGGKPSRTHSFDTGAAWQNLALQGASLGLVVHGMEGFDYEEARSSLNVPDDYQIEAMVAIGTPADRQDLPDDLREREVPSDRKNVSEIAFEGAFPASAS